MTEPEPLLITETVTFSMTTDDKRILDELAPGRQRSAWLRGVLRKAQKKADAEKFRRQRAAQLARKGVTMEAKKA